MSGYDGGLSQTFVIQLSRDTERWINKTEKAAGIDSHHKSYTFKLTNLDSGSDYYLRMLAYNEKGTSEYTTVLNFSTKRSGKRLEKRIK